MKRVATLNKITVNQVRRTLFMLSGAFLPTLIDAEATKDTKTLKEFLLCSPMNRQKVVFKKLKKGWGVYSKEV